MTNSSVNCLLEDSQNTLWMGTWDGLNSYNGREIQTYRYNSRNGKSISNNIIRQIIEEDSIHIWITTDYGVNRLDKRTQIFDRFFENNSGFIMGMMADQTPICYSQNRGLCYFDKKRDTFILIDYNIGNNVHSLAIDSYNNLYVLHGDGYLKKYRINRDDDDEIRIRHSIVVKSDNKISNICLTSSRLIINYASYLKIIDTNTYKETDIKLFGDKIITDVVAKNNYIYIHYDNNEFGRYNIINNELSLIKEVSQQFPFFSMHVGDQNILWIGSDGQGVIGVHEYTSPFKTIQMDITVRCFSEEGATNIWVGTKGEGIKLINKTTGEVEKTITEIDGLSSNSVYALRKNKEGDLFVGADGENINIISPKHSVSHLIIPDRYPKPQDIYSIAFTADSLLWVGTAGNGFYKINLEKRGNLYFAKYVNCYRAGLNSLSANAIYSIERDRENSNLLWLGTRGGGVDLFDTSTGQFSNLESLNSGLSLSDNDVLSLCSSQDNNLWIGTVFGLNKFINTQPYKIIDYSERSEFVNNTIHAILEDRKGNAWASTNHGLLFIDNDTENIIRYSEHNGLQSNEFADGASYMGRDSIFYFGGVKGFSYFQANNIHLRDYEPQVSLSSLQINNVSQNIYERINNNTLDLSYNEPYLTLTFIANDFINNRNCEYSYRIKGFADEWIYNAKQPSIILTKLPSGEYELEVKCTNGDGVWSNNIYRLNLNVAYPWWRSNLAYIGYILFAIAGAYLIMSIVRNRINLNKQILLEHLEKEHQQKIHESKLSFFTNVAHEFFTPLTLIYAPSQLLLDRSETDDYAKKYLRIIKTNADRMQKLISELMEFRKIESGYMDLHPENIDIRQLVESVADNYFEIARVNNIKLEFQFKDIGNFVTDRTSLEKVLFNLISNAFKYTPSEKSIYLNFEQNRDNDTLSFSIKNIGVGLTTKQMSDIFNRFKIYEISRAEGSTTTGIGLNLTKNLVELLAGSISVDSELFSYVEFKVVLPSLATEKDVELITNNITISDEEITTIEKNISERKKKISILIIEDEKDIRALLKDILSSTYDVREASDGEEGLVEVEKNMPNIIISDIMMPNMDGINFIEHLKSNIKTAHIPIISISAKNTIDDHINAYRHGADLYIEKPFNPHHITTTVENIISRFSILQDYFNSSRSSIKIKDGVEVYNEDEQFIQDIIIFIENNIDNDSLSPVAISEYFSVSKTYLYEKLKKTTGKTPGDFIRTIKLEYASKLLITTQLTISEIVYKSGFSSRSYFYKEFAKQFNMSPSEYRASDSDDSSISN